ncbi:MAG: YgjV family protein [Candidatus Gracilibacteria bacterium]|nr:YgjV family protein [Candidatus Gracilibacteria bacterium]
MGIIELINTNPAGQICAFIATGITFYGLTQKDDKQTMKIIMFSAVFWILHGYFMEVYSAMIASSIGLIRIFLSMRYKKNKKVFSLIIITTLTLGIITYENPYSILPIISSMIGAYGYFFFERLKLRMFMFLSSMFWLTFNLNLGSIGGVANEIMVQLILLVAMYKIMKEEHRSIYIFEKLFSKWNKTRLDVGRFISIYDFINIKKHGLKSKIKEKIIYFKNKLNRKKVV